MSGTGHGAGGVGGPGPVSKGRVFLLRLLSSAVLWSVVIWALFSRNALISNGVFLAIMSLLVVAGLVEFYGLVERRGLACFKQLGVAGGLLLVGSTFCYLSLERQRVVGPAGVNDFETGFLVLFVLGLCLRQFMSKSNAQGIVAISTTLFGLFYVAWLLNFIQKLHYHPGLEGGGQYYLLYFIVVTKCSDIGAYSVGSLIGRHKMIPRISPGKTWEGLGGALVVSMGASLAYAGWAGDRMPGMSGGHAAVLGLVLGLGAVMGDLIESLLKREAGVKDSGQWFPGIGGILDLLDSLLFNAPLMYLYLRFFLLT